MLICPECKYENSVHNKFCESCGTSLTHKDCHQCGAEIAYTAPECDVCGATNTTMLLAIIIQGNLSRNADPSTKELASVAAAESINSKTTISSTPENPELINQTLLIQDHDGYLDSQQRYRILEPGQLSTNLIDSDVKVISCQIIDQFPLQESSLNVLRKTKTELFTELATKLQESSDTEVELARNLVKFAHSLEEGDSPGSLADILPAHVWPYFLLEEYTPIVPPIHDAWQDQTQGVVLLGNRSTWQSLTELWSKPQLPLLQVLWYLGEMAKLWIPLSQSHCATSLLIKSNLKVDEDQSFCLEQLYLDPTAPQPTLSDLVAKWYSWLIESEQTYPEALLSVLKQVISGEIQEVEILLDQLHQIVDLAENNLDSNPIDDSSWSNAIDDSPWETTEESEETDFFNIDPNEDSLIYDSDADEQPTAMFTMQIASVNHASYTDIGSSRDHNEDFFGVKTVVTQEENPSEQLLESKGLYIICDGMGGHAAGEVASAMAVETLQNYFHTYWQDEFPSEKTIEEGIFLANQVIYQTNINNSRSGHGRMGTTLVMVLLQDTQIAIAHVGDSRIYRITRQEGLEQLTVDHEVGQREINRGVEPEIAYGRPDAYQLTQALGPRESKNLRPSIQYFDLEKDCLILLCSDGLSDNDLLEKHWQTYLEPLISSNADLSSGLCELMTFADRYNGHDNLTGILVRIKLKPDM